ncbi:MAG: LytR family transcriptional regulator [Ruminococcaceae bacterium]|nr:LytR family transcriptional regulator [Oscillospiraceae bacterium]
MVKIKFKSVLPFLAVALTVFLGVVSAFVCNGIFSMKEDTETIYNDKKIHQRKTILSAVKNPDSGALVSAMVVCFNPKDKTVKTVALPTDTCVEVASSNQMLKNILSIGGTEMLRESVHDILPLPVDYHIIINSTDLYCPDGDYHNAVNWIFSYGLWQQGDIKTYLSQILSLSSTDLSMFNIDDYVEFLNRFAEHTNQYHTIPGQREYKDDRVMYVTDAFSVAEFVNSSIFN